MDPIEDPEVHSSPTVRKFSVLPAFITNAASEIGGVIVRTAEAAGTLLIDADLRKRGTEVIATSATKGLRGIQHGIQTGANTIQRGLYTVGQGPRQLQSVLQRLSQQIEEQRMKILLQEQRDAPVDVQVGFQVYEDAPQELRSRLWMALLQHPELVERYQAVQRADLASQELEESTFTGGQKQQEIETEEHVAAAEEPRQPEGAEEVSQKDQERDQNDLALDEGHIAVPSTPGHASAAAHADAEAPASLEVAGQALEGEGWEVVGDRGADRWRQGRRLLAGGSTHRTEGWTAGKESFRQELMGAMAAVPWPLPTEPDPESRYSTLLQISIGQEEVDDVISRDIHRTFPEYPMFGAQQGQQALFRVLKAYSLHDLETGYCQGMAFVAGLVLFFVPEEVAFQIFCRLLASTGPNLRRFYLPGLRGLKVELRMFDILLGRYLPKLKAHLESQGVVPVLYASQWFLSAFTCPFPVGFACRLVDVMLVENSDVVLMRAALAMMAESEAELLMQEDFEELLTYLKVEPVQWSTHRLRRVLNAAIHDSPITLAELEQATLEAERDEVPLMPSPFTQTDKAIKQVERTRSSSKQLFDVEESAEEASSSAVNAAKEAGCGVAAPQGEEGLLRGGSSGDDLTAELAQHQAELDDAYVQMVLDLDNLWGGSEDGGGAVEAYENALAAQPGNRPRPSDESGSGAAME